MVDESLGYNPELQKISDLIASTRRFPRLKLCKCDTLSLKIINVSCHKKTIISESDPSLNMALWLL